MNFQNNCVKLITHSGTFHADEVTAYIILKRIFKNQSTLIRTRDHDQLKELQSEHRQDRIIFDISSKYEPYQNLFDHHMPEDKKYRRQDSTPYSACGLIWNHFGQTYLEKFSQENFKNEEITKEILAQAWFWIDQNFIFPIDQFDNGCLKKLPQNTDYCMIVDRFNGSEEEENQNFLKASDCAKTIFENEVRYQINRAIKIDRAIDKIKESSDLRYVISEEKHDFQAALTATSNENMLYAVTKGWDQNWYIHAMRVNETTFEARKDLPQSWAGLRGKDLAKITGCESAIFCHSALFIAAASKKEDILKMLEQALN